MSGKLSHMLAGAVGGLATGAAIITFSLYMDSARNYSTSSKPESTTPSISHYLGSRIYFNDDLAPGMKAYASYKTRENQDEVVELEANFYAGKYAEYTIPQELMKIEKFQIWAVDRDGNKSGVVKFTTLDNIIVKTDPPSE